MRYCILCGTEKALELERVGEAEGAEGTAETNCRKPTVCTTAQRQGFIRLNSKQRRGTYNVDDDDRGDDTPLDP